METSVLQWEEGQPVTLTLLGDQPLAGTGRILQLAGERLRLATGLAAEPGAPLQIEWGSHLLLGEVSGVESGGAEPELWVHVVHTLSDVEALAAQRQAWRL